MASKDRRARHKQLVRQEILDAARDILVKEGYEHLSMRRVAEKIEYSPTAIYLHFKDKNELVFSVCEETFSRLVRELESSEKEFKDPLVRLKKGLRRYVDFGLRHPQHYLATFVVPHDDDDPELAAKYHHPETMGMRALGTLRATVDACVRQGKLRRVDVDTATRALWGAVHGITSLMIVFELFPWGDRDAVVDLLIDSVVDGLRQKR
jgi:AcrR family transcriptional regulator